MEKKLYRVIDANFNRAKEGLRVCEDVCRFVYNRKALTARYKSVRHRLTEAIAELPKQDLLKARDIRGDVGRPSIPAELRREKMADVFDANSQRIKESIRVLEECTKLIRPRAAERLKKLRYEIYALEKKSLVSDP